ncbi:hypothetical protein BGZ93_005622 [Podila epicladia]|nr:hypothetical protein BGZ92_006575 [Podila epicladia]KAG0099863.1 hypothetical protein BGZ93_005622 [Podila epicladia]
MKLTLATIIFASLALRTLSATRTKACTPTTLGFRIPIGGNDPTVYTWFYVHGKYDDTTSYEKMDWEVHCSGDGRYCAQALESDYKDHSLRARVKYEGRCILYGKEDKRTRQNDHDIFEFFGCIH